MPLIANSSALFRLLRVIGKTLFAAWIMASGASHACSMAPTKITKGADGVEEAVYTQNSIAIWGKVVGQREVLADHERQQTVTAILVRVEKSDTTAAHRGDTVYVYLYRIADTRCTALPLPLTLKDYPTGTSLRVITPSRDRHAIPQWAQKLYIRIAPIK